MKGVDTMKNIIIFMVLGITATIWFWAGLAIAITGGIIHAVIGFAMMFIGGFIANHAAKIWELF